MTLRQIQFGEAQLTIPNTWAEITDEVEGTEPPFTLADSEEGVGALQFSFGLFKDGLAPNPSEQDLRDMVLRFSEERDLGDAFDDSSFSTESLVGAGMSFHSEEDFIRVWYVSDRRSFAMVTYVCEWGEQDQELPLCEEIIQSLKFST